MKIDNIENPEEADRWLVIDVESGDEIEHVAWADDEASKFATFRLRGRTLADKDETDRRIRRRDGSFALDEHEGEIQIHDKTDNPVKNAFLALLDDPEVVAAINRATGHFGTQEALASTMDAIFYSLRGDGATAREKLAGAEDRLLKSVRSDDLRN